MFRLTHFGSFRFTKSMSRKNPFDSAYIDFGSWHFGSFTPRAETFLNRIAYFISAHFPPPTGGIRREPKPFPRGAN